MARDGDKGGSGPHLLPALYRFITLAKAQKEAALPGNEARRRLERLADGGLVMIYTVDGLVVYERDNPPFVTEQHDSWHQKGACPWLSGGVY